MLLLNIDRAKQQRVGLEANTKLLVIASEEVIRYQEYSACISGLDHLVEFLDIQHTSFQPIGKFLPRYVLKFLFRNHFNVVGANFMSFSTFEVPYFHSHFHLSAQ